MGHDDGHNTQAHDVFTSGGFSFNTHKTHTLLIKLLLSVSILVARLTN